MLLLWFCCVTSLNLQPHKKIHEQLSLFDNLLQTIIRSKEALLLSKDAVIESNYLLLQQANAGNTFAGS